MSIISRGQRVQRVTFGRLFEYDDLPGAGFSFPCDEQGNLLDEDGESITAVAEGNYKACLTGIVEGRHVSDKGVERYASSYWQPAVLLCSCGAEVEAGNLPLH